MFTTQSYYNTIMGPDESATLDDACAVPMRHTSGIPEHVQYP